MENNISDRRIVITAGLGIAAVLIVLLAMFMSGNTPGAEAIGIAFVMIILLTAVAIIKTTKKRTVLSGGLVLGVLMIIAGIVLSAVFELKNQPDGFSAMIMGGFIMVLICGMSLRRPKDYDLRDERALKIGTWAISYSWYLAFLCVILMFWLSYFNVILLTVQAVLGIMMFLMPVSAILFQWYFSKKGDVY